MKASKALGTRHQAPGTGHWALGIVGGLAIGLAGGLMVAALFTPPPAAATNPFASYSTSLNAPGENWAEVEASTNALATVPRALWVGTGGNLSVTSMAGDSETFVNVPSGTLLSIRPAYINTNGTTASDLVGVW